MTFKGEDLSLIRRKVVAIPLKITVFRICSGMISWVVSCMETLLLMRDIYRP
jgi:hypothetical protein